MRKKELLDYLKGEFEAELERYEHMQSKIHPGHKDEYWHGIQYGAAHTYARILKNLTGDDTFMKELVGAFEKGRGTLLYRRLKLKMSKKKAARKRPRTRPSSKKS